MRKRAYLLGREMIWSQVAQLYMESFQRARRTRVDAAHRPLAVRTLEEQPLALPRIRLDHLLRMTDSAGVFQHACHTIPDFREGYCTDDNARALVLMILLEELGHDEPEIRQATTCYAAFLHYAFDAQRNGFHNFLSFDRQWLDGIGSDDSLGRVIWALGTCVGRSHRRNLLAWAMPLFDRALLACAETSSPRAWAFGLIGIHEYFRRLSGDRLVNQIRETFTTRLVDLYERTAGDGWRWFEDVACYDNAKLSHALILSGCWTENVRAREIGLESLRWLAELQRASRGHFRPIGCRGFLRRGEEPAEFDQQPIEAQAMLSAAIEAYRATSDPFWLNQARLAFEWFLGRNDVGVPLYDSSTGGCRDGLHEDRVNENQGAESTLAFLLSLAEMKLLEESRTVFPEAGTREQQSSPFVGTDVRK